MNLLAAVTLLEAAVTAAEEIARAIRVATSEEGPSAEEIEQARTRSDAAMDRLRSLAAPADEADPS